jgi:hypothetical protein
MVCTTYSFRWPGGVFGQLRGKLKVDEYLSRPRFVLYFENSSS